MGEKLREILLTRYIGSMLIALLCSQALIELIEKIAQTIFWVINASVLALLWAPPIRRLPGTT